MYLNLQYPRPPPGSAVPLEKIPRGCMGGWGASGKGSQIQAIQMKPLSQGQQNDGELKRTEFGHTAYLRQSFPSQNRACQPQQETRGLCDKCCGLSLALLLPQWVPGDSAIKVPFKPGRVESRGCVLGQHFPLLFQFMDTYKFSGDSGTVHASAAATSRDSLKVVQGPEKSITDSN